MASQRPSEQGPCVYKTWHVPLYIAAPLRVRHDCTWRSMKPLYIRIILTFWLTRNNLQKFPSAHPKRVIKNIQEQNCIVPVQKRTACSRTRTRRYDWVRRGRGALRSRRRGVRPHRTAPRTLDGSSDGETGRTDDREHTAPDIPACVQWGATCGHWILSSLMGSMPLLWQ